MMSTDGCRSDQARSGFVVYRVAKRSVRSLLRDYGSNDRCGLALG